MKPLQALRLFIQAKDSDEERHEIREYVLAEAPELAPEFGVTAEQLIDAVNGIGDEVALSRGLLTQITVANTNGNRERASAKDRECQVAADKLGASATWKDGRAYLDVALLFASLTRTADAIRFWVGPHDLVLRQRPLSRLAELHKRDLTAYLDEKGLHFRWATGGLSFCHQQLEPAEQPRITVNLPDPAPAREESRTPDRTIEKGDPHAEDSQSDRPGLSAVPMEPVRSRPDGGALPRSPRGRRSKPRDPVPVGPVEVPNPEPPRRSSRSPGSAPPRNATPGRVLTPEALIDAMQAKCLALLEEVQSEATAQIEHLGAELADRDRALAEQEAWIAELQRAGAIAANLDLPDFYPVARQAPS